MVRRSTVLVLIPLCGDSVRSFVGLGHNKLFTAMVNDPPLTDSRMPGLRRVGCIDLREFAQILRRTDREKSDSIHGKCALKQ